MFIIRLEDGEILHEKVEEFARTHAIAAAAVIALGGIDEGSNIFWMMFMKSPVSALFFLIGIITRFCTCISPVVGTNLP